MSGALLAWSRCNQLIYNRTYRICGTPENIIMSLSYYGFSELKIRKIIKDSITNDNYLSSKNNDYEQEILRHLINTENRP
jgi:hypothetical protein